ncbi:hypothetical protein BOTBODRAFT_181571 [Botryobasidium botryosum FD-172 SS1]|uniref:Uncharacterized protein n=1 Tax=Botryobasidium botryosum (strain FD-172 SS1) TaxID=930990 RepID=A0A067LTQ3_BOTB1|nr:hypothetical protein BOTBODRAFT_181571 [Botryobasidium botryosum FD-172 SS1]
MNASFAAQFEDGVDVHPVPFDVLAAATTDCDEECWDEVGVDEELENCALGEDDLSNSAPTKIIFPIPGGSKPQVELEEGELEEGEIQEVSESSCCHRQNLLKRKVRDAKCLADEAGQRARNRVCLIPLAQVAPLTNVSGDKLDHSQPGYTGVKRGVEFFSGKNQMTSKEQCIGKGYEYLGTDVEQHALLLPELNDLILVARANSKSPQLRGQVAGTNIATATLQSKWKGKGIGKCSPRGNFGYCHNGHSFGGGQKGACNFTMHDSDLDGWKEFFNNPDVQGLMKFAKDVFKTWFPQHYKYYKKCLEDHLEHNKECGDPKKPLRQPHPTMPFAAMEVNTGPHTMCKCHKDHKNLAFGLCMLIILVVIELAPGDVIFFPSALITHQNLPILPHEFRYSITGYTASNLFQLRDQGFLSKAQVRRLIIQEELAIRA